MPFCIDTDCMMQIKFLLKYLFVAGVVVWLFSGCDRDRVFEQNREIASEGWAAEDLKTFRIQIEDTLQLHHFYLNVRHDVAYPYSNIFLFMNTFYPDQRVARDTIECFLAGRDGQWLGSGYGGVKFDQIPVRTHFRFPQKGEYVFQLQQAMRTDTLKFIKDVGIRVEMAPSETGQ